jgi:preprotein translocase subunit SecF
MLAALGSLLYRARWVALPLSLAVVLGAALYGTGVFGTLTSGGFEDPNSQSAQARAYLDQQLGGWTPDIVVLMRSDTLSATDPAFAGAATQLLNTLQAQPGVASVTSYYSTQSPRLLSRDGHETFAAVQFATTAWQEKAREYKALKPLITSSTLQVSVGGDVAVNDAVNAQVSADLERAEMLSFPVLAILLVIVFASLVAAGLPLVVGGVAIVGAFAALRLLTGLTPISIFAVNVVTVLGLGLAIDYALFIVTRFREELDASAGDTRHALERTLATAGRTVLFSGLTVSMSLLGLLLFPEGFLRSMGLGAISAVLVAMLAALILLPALLAILGRRVNSLSLQRLFRRSAARPNCETQGAWYRLSQFVMRWPVPVAVAGLAVLVTLGAPFLHASFSTPDVRVLPAKQEARVASDRLAQDFAQQGASSIVVAIHTPGDALSSVNLARLDGYVRQIEAMPNVIAVQSLVSVNPSLTLADYQRLYAQPDRNPQLAAVAGQLAHGAGTKVVGGCRAANTRLACARWLCAAGRRRDGVSDGSLQQSARDAALRAGGDRAGGLRVALPDDRLGGDANQGDPPQHALADRDVRRAGLDLPGREPDAGVGFPVQRQHRRHADDPDLRAGLRPLDGLRGLPAQPHQGALRRHRRQPRGGRLRPAAHWLADQQRRPAAGGSAGGDEHVEDRLHRADRRRAGDRGDHGRDAGAQPTRARDDASAGPLELVGAGADALHLAADRLARGRSGRARGAAGGR